MCLSALSASCGDSHEPHDPVPLVDHDQWQAAVLGDDPFFALERPEEYSCEPMFYASELFGAESSFSIDTGSKCGYLTVKQTTVADVKLGDPVHARIWHFPLTAPDEEAEGHVAIMMGDRVVFEDRIPLPATSKLYAAYWTSDQDFPIGTAIYYHVHNHGVNSWALLEISEGKEPPAPSE